MIKPQYAIERLYALTRGRDVYVTTEVGQHQMWAAQFLPLRRAQPLDDLRRPRHHGATACPPRWGCRWPNPKSLVIDIAGEASVQMTMQEMSTAVQYELPIKIFILNNEWMGMVRQWQQLLHGERYSHSYSESLPISSSWPRPMARSACGPTIPMSLDAKIMQMISSPKPVLFDCRVTKDENCFPDDPLGQGATTR